MFEVGCTELLLDLRPGALVLGPQKLPKLASSWGGGSGARAPWRGSSATSSRKRPTTSKPR